MQICLTHTKIIINICKYLLYLLHRQEKYNLLYLIGIFIRIYEYLLYLICIFKYDIVF